MKKTFPLREKKFGKFNPPHFNEDDKVMGEVMKELDRRRELCTLDDLCLQIEIKYLSTTPTVFTDMLLLTSGQGNEKMQNLDEDPDFDKNLKEKNMESLKLLFLESGLSESAENSALAAEVIAYITDPIRVISYLNQNLDFVKSFTSLTRTFHPLIQDLRIKLFLGDNPNFLGLTQNMKTFKIFFALDFFRIVKNLSNDVKELIKFLRKPGYGEIEADEDGEEDEDDENEEKNKMIK
jgi:hypothetical protein